MLPSSVAAATAATATPSVAHRPGSLEAAIRALPKAWFTPRRSIYWGDMVLSATVGWLAFFGAARMHGVLRLAFTALAAAALYRAVLFTHEITHLNARDVPWFSTAWNVLVGVPLLIPSFLYQGVHTDHHRPRCYGTVRDPEYVPYARQPLRVAFLSVVLALFVPLAFVMRFAVLAPLAWIVPRWRRGIDARASALVINHHYVRHTSVGVAGRIQEVAATSFVWTASALWATGLLSTTYVWQWLLVGALISFVNAWRTLAAHRYDAGDEALTMTEQLLDSCTLSPTTTPMGHIGHSVRTLTHAVIAPVGLRYHALHHWIPSLPYHNLGRAHRRLLATLQKDAPYHLTIEPHLPAAIGRLARRARERRT